METGSMSAFSRTEAQNQTPFLAVMCGMILLAWLSLWLWGQSPYSRFISHDHGVGGVGFLDGPGVMSLFVAGWTLMVVAMMLPTTLPLIGLFRGIVRTQEQATLLVGLLLIGYILSWTLFGLVAHLGDAGIHLIVDRSAWFTANAWVIASGTLIGAGIYQFTELKYRCLDKCRSPFSFIMSHWRGRNRQSESISLGLHHGLYCIGCCWTLMLLMFVVGMGNLAWMLLLGTVMAIEKNVSWGRKLVRPLGIVLITWGVSLAMLALVDGH
jgi:predicted metal-binding membrane protein